MHSNIGSSRRRNVCDTISWALLDKGRTVCYATGRGDPLLMSNEILDLTSKKSVQVFPTATIVSCYFRMACGLY